MSFMYDETHSVTIGEKNTWKDWKLIPNQRPSFAPPLPKNNFVEVLGGNGSLDLTESLTGYTTYNDRNGSWEFIVADEKNTWYDVYSEILTYLQGKHFKAVLEDDKYFYYEGRFWLNEERSDPEASKIVMEYNVRPYKMEINSSVEDWLWDPFDFKYGVIRDYRNLKIEGSLSVTLFGTKKPTCPIITVKGTNLKVQYNGETYNLPEGKNVIPYIMIKSEDVKLTFTGTGTVSIDYRGGRL